MLVVPVYNMVLTPDASIYFQTEQLRRNSGGKGIAEKEKIILIVAKENQKAGELTPESFYPIGVAGIISEINQQGYAVVRTQYRVNLLDIWIVPDHTIQLTVSRRLETDDLDAEIEAEKTKNIKQEMLN